MVLNMGPLGWLSSALTTRPLLHYGKFLRHTHQNNSSNAFYDIIKQHKALARFIDLTLEDVKDKAVFQIGWNIRISDHRIC